ncbi:MAG: hypothetical protein IJL24_06970, partial [Treponema sp.]|nr:hypothetical protein [Treponema sp.]
MKIAVLFASGNIYSPLTRRTGNANCNTGGQGALTLKALTRPFFGAIKIFAPKLTAFNKKDPPLKCTPI